MGDPHVVRGIRDDAGDVTLIAIRFVVFDLDGTLVDSRRDLAESANQVLGESGAALRSEEDIGRMVGDGAAILVARAFAAAGVPQPPHALARFLEVYNSRLLKFTTPYPGVPEMLDRLGERVTLAVLTNKPLAPTTSILSTLGLSKHFHGRVLGGDGPLPRKPDPAGLRSVIDRATVPARETLRGGDSVIDWRTARAAHARSCIARYGFGFTGFPVEEARADDSFSDRPGDILSLL